MAILIPGTLTVMTRNGRYGAFNTGKLSTSIGEFVVKDKVLGLDQYEPGKYDGQFEIEKIKSTHYTYGNCLVVECRAYLASMTLNSNTDLTDEEVDALSTKEQDPLEEEKLLSADTPKNNSQDHNFKTQSTEPIADTATRVVEPSHDETLFGLLWPLGDSVKLDSTCGREILRQQKNRLTELGYEFDYKTQLWNLIEAF